MVRYQIHLKLVGMLMLLAGSLMPAMGQATSDSSSSGMNMNMGSGMSMEMPTDAPIVPAVNGFIDGEKMLFIHTEISDPDVAKILVDMMGGSPVPVVPSLADAPASMLAPVYVFTNGYGGKGPMGPLGGQPDIFVSAPGQPGYSPLRDVMLTTWGDGAMISVLTSYDALKAQIDSGAISVRKAGIVVNMPFLTWPGGGTR
jgi:hypothetical protein